jgi:hypothetical protein
MNYLLGLITGIDFCSDYGFKIEPHGSKAVRVENKYGFAIVIDKLHEPNGIDIISDTLDNLQWVEFEEDWDDVYYR